MLTGCSSKQPQEKSLETGSAVFLTLGAFHIKLKWSLGHGRQTEACFPVDMMIVASLSKVIWIRLTCPFKRCMFLSAGAVVGVPAPCPGPPELFMRSASVKDSSHHLGLSPLTQNQSLHIPSIPINGRKAGRKGRKTTLREHLPYTRCILIHYHSFSLHCAVSSIFILHL